VLFLSDYVLAAKLLHFASTPVNPVFFFFLIFIMFNLQAQMFNSTVRPTNKANLQDLIAKCFGRGLIPTPNYKGTSNPQENFIYMVVAPQGIITGYQGAAGAHTEYLSNIPNNWQPSGGGGDDRNGVTSLGHKALRNMAKDNRLLF
jgi:hypothetical protein